MGITRPCTHLHPAASTSTQVSATPSTLLEPKYRTLLGIFPKFRPKNSGLSILTKVWHTRYFGGADSKSRLEIFEIPIPKSIFGKICAAKVKICLPENWHTWYLEDPNSYSNISFQNLKP